VHHVIAEIHSLQRKGLVLLGGLNRSKCLIISHNSWYKKPPFCCA
jgi:hypothetical protein